MSETKKVLVLGATGHFGKRISRRLIGEPNSELIVTSRSESKARVLANELRQPDYRVFASQLDQFSEHFERDIAGLAPDIVIHTAGPYQGQSYRVANTCISIGCHYIDLADGRSFVENFASLNESAIQAGVLAVSGASTLPGLSSAVVDRFRTEFESIKSIRISIAPAHQTPRGIGTISAVLSYCGKPFEVLENGSITTKYGWQDLKWQKYPTLGSRLSAACDVPDLSLMQQYVPEVETVTFHAALEASWEQLGLWCLGWLGRLGVVSNWSRAAPLFDRISENLISLGSQQGGMQIELMGQGVDGNVKKLTWHLTAGNNHGPEIPCTPALILARKLLRNQLSYRGALPCLGLIDIEDFDHEVKFFDISWEVT